MDVSRIWGSTYGRSYFKSQLLAIKIYYGGAYSEYRGVGNSTVLLNGREFSFYVCLFSVVLVTTSV